MNKCNARHDLTRNVLICHREPGHEGMHRDSGQNLYWHPGAPPLERIVLEPTGPVHEPWPDTPEAAAGHYAACNPENTGGNRMTDYEPHYRYWVAEKLDVGWRCKRKTNWRWVAYWHALRMSRRGYRYKVEDRG